MRPKEVRLIRGSRNGMFESILDDLSFQSVDGSAQL